VAVGDAVNPVDPDLELVPAGDGHLLRGRKNFATGVSTGDASVVSGTVRHPDGTTGDHLLVVVGATTPGCAEAATGTTSASGCPPVQRDVRRRGDRPRAGGRRPGREPRHAAFLAGHPGHPGRVRNLYLGIAQGAMAPRGVHAGHLPPVLLSDSPSAAADPYVLANYGRLVARCGRSARWPTKVRPGAGRRGRGGRRLSWGERGELAELIAALKVVSTDVALHVTATIFEVTGARATSNAVGLDRFWRNVRTHTLHDRWPTSSARWATTSSTAPTPRSRCTRNMAVYCTFMALWITRASLGRGGCTGEAASVAHASSMARRVCSSRRGEGARRCRAPTSRCRGQGAPRRHHRLTSGQASTEA